MGNKRWYVTVGVPGGEYAVKDIDAGEAQRSIARSLNNKDYVRGGHFDSIRPAPPELSEWLDAELGGETKYGWKVFGGFAAEFPPCAVFIPVALAGGITVMEEAE